MVAVARPTYRITTKYLKDVECFIKKHSYCNNRICLRLVSIDGEPQAMATVNIENQPCPEGHSYIKDYSENEGMLDALIKLGIVSRPVSYVNSGFCSIPLCKILI